MTSELKCTKYWIEDCDDWGKNWRPLNCPVCAGFLKWNDGEPTCKKCGTELMVIPEVDEETGEELECGKVCPISERKVKAEK